jgi:hypothetical protein
VRNNKNIRIEVTSSERRGHRTTKKYTYFVRPSTPRAFYAPSQCWILHVVRLSEACSVIAGVQVCASGGSATVTGFDSGLLRHIILSSPVVFPSRSAMLDLIRIGRRGLRTMHHIGHNSSSCSNYLFIMSFRGPFTFIDSI